MVLKQLLVPSAALVCLWALGCGGSHVGGVGAPLAPGARAHAPATGLRIASSPARGVLAYAAALDADESTLVTVELTVAFELVVRDLERNGRAHRRARVRLGDPTYDIEDLALDAGAEEAWVASADGTVRAVDLSRGRVTETWRLGDPATAVAVAHDSYVATGTETGVLCLRRRRDAALLQCVAAHEARVSALDFGAIEGAPVLASASWDGSVKLWKVPSLALIAEHHAPGSNNDVALSPDGSLVAIAHSAAPPQRSPRAAAKERHRSASRADPGSRVDLWAPASDSILSCVGHAAPVTAVAWTPDGASVLSASWDRTIRLWNAARGAEVAALGGFQHLVRDVTVGGSGRLAAAAAWSPDLEGRSVVLLELLYPGR